MGAVREYLLRLVAVCMLAALAAVLVHSSPASRIVRLIGGVLVLLVAVSPLLSIDTQQLSRNLERICAEHSFDTSAVEENTHAALALHIKRTPETYIESKAASLGAAIQAKVEVSDDEQPVPERVTIIGTLTAEQTLVLRQYLTESLGIAPEKQEWKLYGISE